MDLCSRVHHICPKAFPRLVTITAFVVPVFTLETLALVIHRRHPLGPKQTWKFPRDLILSVFGNVEPMSIAFYRNPYMMLFRSTTSVGKQMLVGSKQRVRSWFHLQRTCHRHQQTSRKFNNAWRKRFIGLNSMGRKKLKPWRMGRSRFFDSCASLGKRSLRPHQLQPAHCLKMPMIYRSRQSWRWHIRGADVHTSLWRWWQLWQWCPIVYVHQERKDKERTVKITDIRYMCDDIPVTPWLCAKDWFTSLQACIMSIY